MRGRDPLLGPTNPRGRSNGKRLWPVTVIAMMGFIALIAFLAGNWWRSRELADRMPSAASSKTSANPQTRNPSVIPPAVVARVRVPEPPFRLKPLTEADSNKVGMGCRCSFSMPGSSSELVIAGGDDLAVFRPNGSLRVCALGADHLQAMVDGDARIDCGSSRLLIKEYGPKRPGFDGHSSAAKLTVIHSGGERVFDGTWGCYC
jgi:hypothetical protein